MIRSRGKRAALAAVAVLAVGIGTGCATGGGGGTDGENGGEDSGPVALRYAYWGGVERIARHDAVVDLFEEANENITMESQVAAFQDHINRMSVEASGRNMPDVAQMQDRFLREFAAGGALLDLGPYIEDGTIDVSNIPESVLARGQFEGAQVMIPSGTSFHVMMYEEAMFEAAGVEPPQPGYTWADYADTLIELAESGSLGENVYPGQTSCETDWAFYGYLKGHGIDPFAGEDIAFDVDDVEQWFTYWADLLAAGAVPPPEFEAEHAPPGGNAEDNLTAKGMDASGMHPANQIDVISEVRGVQLNMAGVPEGPEGPGNLLVASGLSISANSENPDAGAKFIDFWVNNEDAAVAYRADNGVPTSTVAYAAVREVVDSRQLEIFPELEDNFGNFEPFPDASQRIITSLPLACERVLFGQQSPAESAEAFMVEVGG